MRGTQSFAGVEMSIPAKVRRTEAEEDWQEVDWQRLSTGDLTVDVESFLLVFRPTGGGQAVKAMTLGTLVRASAVQGDEPARTLVVTTTDAAHQNFRMTFQDGGEFNKFFNLAKAAEAATEARNKEGDVQHDVEAEERKAAESLAGQIQAALASRSSPPMVFTRAELYGRDPNGEEGSEVLLAQGALALVDPVGKNEFHEVRFYSHDDGGNEPVHKWAITSHSKLRSLPKESADDDDSAPAVPLQLTFPNAQGKPEVFTVTFQEECTAACFSRDFSVRAKLMVLANRSVKGADQEQELRGQIEGLKLMTMGARLRRLLGMGAMLVALASVSRVFMHYKQDIREERTRAPHEYAALLASDAANLVGNFRGVAVDVGAFAMGLVSPDDLERCVAAADALNPERDAYPVLRRCVKGLARK